MSATPADLERRLRFRNEEIRALKAEINTLSRQLAECAVMQLQMNASPLLTRIVTEVADREAISIADIMGSSKQPHIAHPRQEVMARLAAAGKSRPAIGRMLDKDASTVTHGIHAYMNRSMGKPVDMPMGGWVFRSRRSGE